MSYNVNLTRKNEAKPQSKVPSLEGPRFTCALGGAYGTVLAIEKAVPILHSGAGCGFANLFGYSYGAGLQGVGYVGGCATPSCNLTENEVVFGGEKRLQEQIQGTLNFIEGDLYVVIAGCIPGLIGDNISAVVNEVKSEVPLIYTEAAGFSGTSYQGYEKVLLSIIEQLLPDKVPKEKGLVNIFGVVPFQNIFWKGDLQEIKRVLGKLGLEANIIFGDPAGVKTLEKIPAAEYNIVFSPWVGKTVAEKLKEKYDTPYLVVPYLPVGGQDSTAFLKLVAEKLGVPEITLSRVIQEEERDFYHDIDNASDFLIFGFPTLPFAVVGDSNYVVGHTRFLTNELGFLPCLVIITDNPTEEARPIIEQAVGEVDSPIKPEVVYEPDSYNIKQLLEKEQIAVLLASSKEKHYALNKGLLYLSVSFPAFDRVILRRTYAGYRGGSALVEDLSTTVAMPF